MNQAPTKDKSSRFEYETVGLINQTPAELMIKKDFAFFQFHILLEYFPNFRR